MTLAISRPTFAVLPTWHHTVRDGLDYTLEDLRDQVVKQNTDRSAEDLYGSLDLTHVDWSADTITASLIGSGGMSEPMKVTRWAMSQMARIVLPAHGSKTLFALRGRGNHGSKVATIAWATLREGCDNEVVFRTVRDETGHLVLRGVVSPSFADFTDLHMTELLLEKLGNISILDARRGQKNMRIRIRTDGLNEAPTLRNPIPMIESMNGEVGAAFQRTAGGLWTLICLNGQTSYVPERMRKFRHLGSVDKLRARVVASVDGEIVRGKGILDLYNKARDTAIDDLTAFMEKELAGHGVLKLTGVQIDNSVKMLTHQFIATEDWSLARAVDAVTLAAQDETDTDQQEKMEQAATRLMYQGFKAA